MKAKRLIALALAAVFMLSAAATPVFAAAALPQENAALEQQNEEQRIANKELERILSDGTEEEYIERIAREQLGFAYPEEQVLVDISGS